MVEISPAPLLQALHAITGMALLKFITQFKVWKTRSPMGYLITGFIFTSLMLFSSSAGTDQPVAVQDNSSEENVCDKNDELKDACYKKHKSTKRKSGEKSSMPEERRRVDHSSGDCEKYRTLMNLRARIIYGCFSREQIGNPDLKGGKVTIKVSIDETGKVTEVQIVFNSVQDSGSMENCIINSIGKWRFPKPESACTLAHSFIITEH